MQKGVCGRTGYKNMKRLLLIISALGVLVVGISGYLFHVMKASRCVEPVISYSFDRLKQGKNLVDIAILGSGPAGWSAALYGARLGFNTLVIAGAEPGGQLTKTSYVENWPGITKILGTQAMERLAHQAQAFGAEELNEVITDVDLCTWPYVLTTDDGKIIRALTLIIATGAWPRTLGIPGEKEYWGRGVTTCAVCDAPFFKGKDVVVVGGGDSAVEEVKQLAAYARHITMLVRKGQLRASHVMQRQLVAMPQVAIMYNADLEQIVGNDRGVTAVQIRNNATRQSSVLPVEGVFLAIGHDPNTALFKDKIAMDEHGYLVMKGRSQESSVGGVFAAGDVEDNRYRQAGVAAGHGIAAAIDAATFLNHSGFTKEIAHDLAQQGAYFEQASGERAVLEHLTSMADFERSVLRVPGLVILDFYTDACPSCLHMMPAYEMVAARYASQARFFKVNAEQAQDIVTHFKVPRVPYIMAFLHGKQVAVVSTVLSKKELSEFITSLLAQVPEDGALTADEQESDESPSDEPSSGALSAS